jgi:arylsulfatase A-like enzyme
MTHQTTPREYDPAPESNPQLTGFRGRAVVARRRWWPGAFALLCLFLALPLAARSAPTGHPDKPNIILIMADDLGYAAPGCYGQKLILTPEIDKMAGQGLRFTDFYAASAACVPSRVGLLLGQHPGHAPIRDNLPPHLPDFKGYMQRHPAELWPPKLPTLGRVMKDAGYKTAQFGKLEAGLPMAPGKMNAHGWDHWFGFRGTGEAFQFYPLELWKNDQKIEFPENRPEEVRRPGIVGERGTYSQELFMVGILEFIRKNKENPFFIYFPTQLPHGRSPADGDELQLPDIGPYADRDWTHLEKLYAAAVTRLDSDIGRILRELESQGLDEDTLVILTSDNGDENSYYKYTRRFAATGPLKGKKRYLYEGGIRVPMIARWPGKIRPGRTTSIPAAAWDFIATFADLAGVAPPAHGDGISLAPTLLGRSDRQKTRDSLYWEYHQGKQQAVRLGPWKGIRIGGTNEPIELYHLASDPGETRDVAADQPEIVERVARIMEQSRADSEFNRFWPLPDHRLEHIAPDNHIYNQIKNGIR